MTELEALEWFNMAFGDTFEYYDLHFDKVERHWVAYRKQDGRKRGGVALSLDSMSANSFCLLISKGFDVFGLIEAKLAIDKNEAKEV